MRESEGHCALTHPLWCGNMPLHARARVLECWVLQLCLAFSPSVVVTLTLCQQLEKLVKSMHTPVLCALCVCCLPWPESLSLH